jgi:hypothetical protein
MRARHEVMVEQGNQVSERRAANSSARCTPNAEAAPLSGWQQVGFAQNSRIEQTQPFAVAFSAGGGGGRRLPELPAAHSHLRFADEAFRDLLQ